MEANAGLGPTPTYVLVLFLHLFHRRACCPRFFFPLSRTRTSSRGKARAAGEPSASRRWYGAIELRSRRAIRHGSAHPLRCDGRRAAPSSEKPYLFWQHVSTLTGCPQHPSDLPRTSHITSRPFPVRAVRRRLPVCCAPQIQ
jgi:hypothetical protein